jgi:hypothetical protein
MLRRLELEDMDRASVSFDHALPTLPRLHTPEEDRCFFRDRVFATCQLWGYFDNQELVGIIAFRYRGVATTEVCRVDQPTLFKLEPLDLPAQHSRSPVL